RRSRAIRSSIGNCSSLSKITKNCGNEIYNSITTRSSFLHLGKFY
ncbi:Long-chain-fatty-acid--CoA ligase FadD15, partial [Haemophilus influenzae]